MGISLTLIFAVGAGSCLGGILRFVLSRVIQCNCTGTFPWGTLTVNLLGCLLLGMLYGLADSHFKLSDAMRMFLTVGFCGGFTTFSTFAGETFSLFQPGGNVTLGLLYIAVTVILGILLLYGGYLIAGMFFGTSARCD